MLGTIRDTFIEVGMHLITRNPGHRALNTGLSIGEKIVTFSIVRIDGLKPSAATSTMQE